MEDAEFNIPRHGSFLPDILPKPPMDILLSTIIVILMVPSR